MTLIDDPSVAGSAPASHPGPAPDPFVGPPADPDRTAPAVAAKQRSQVVLVLLGCAVALGLLVLVDGLLAHVWYTNRQHHLASDLTAQRHGVATGQALGVIQIPKIGVNAVVVEGDSPDQIRSGPGHRVGTPVPGDTGNSVISAHHTRWGGTFAKLGQLQVGDLLVVQPKLAPVVVFQVISTTRVHASDARLFLPSRDHRLTLVTAAGGLFSSDRLVVQAVSGSVIPGAGKGHGTPSAYPQSSPWQNSHLLWLVFWLGVGLAATAVAWRRYRRVTAVAIVLPFFLLALLQLFLAADAVLPILR